MPDPVRIWIAIITVMLAAHATFAVVPPAVQSVREGVVPIPVAPPIDPPPSPPVTTPPPAVVVARNDPTPAPSPPVTPAPMPTPMPMPTPAPVPTPAEKPPEVPPAKPGLRIDPQTRERPLILVLLAGDYSANAPRREEWGRQLDALRGAYPGQLVGDDLLVQTPDGPLLAREWQAARKPRGYPREAMQQALIDAEKTTAPLKEVARPFTLLIWDGDYNPEADRAEWSVRFGDPQPALIWLRQLEEERYDKVRGSFPKRLALLDRERLASIPTTVRDNLLFWGYRPRGR